MNASRGEIKIREILENVKFSSSFPAYKISSFSKIFQLADSSFPAYRCYSWKNLEKFVAWWDCWLEATNSGGYTLNG